MTLAGPRFWPPSAMTAIGRKAKSATVCSGDLRSAAFEMDTEFT